MATGSASWHSRGTAFPVCPLTLDYGAFQQSLDAVDVHTIPLGGSNISSAIWQRAPRFANVREATKS